MPVFHIYNEPEAYNTQPIIGDRFISLLSVREFTLTSDIEKEFCKLILGKLLLSLNSSFLMTMQRTRDSLGQEEHSRNMTFHRPPLARILKKTENQIPFPR